MPGNCSLHDQKKYVRPFLVIRGTMQPMTAKRRKGKKKDADNSNNIVWGIIAFPGGGVLGPVPSKRR
jgi:hypothetical protein